MYIVQLYIVLGRVLRVHVCIYITLHTEYMIMSAVIMLRICGIHEPNPNERKRIKFHVPRLANGVGRHQHLFEFI